MKKSYLFIVMTLFAFVACDNGEEEQLPGAGETQTLAVDASESGVWQYISLAHGYLGSGNDDDTDNETWAAQTNWDIAIGRYSVKTNSGTSSSVNSAGGVYTFDETIEFASITTVPSDATYTVDKIDVSYGYGGAETQVSKSTAQVIQFKTDADGSMVMPPVYLQSPVYLFRTANGTSQYKVLFTQYVNAEGNAGYVEFDYAEVQ